MKLKKLVALILALVTPLSLVACGSGVAHPKLSPVS